MFVLGDLFSQTDWRDMARAMYIRALSGYASYVAVLYEWWVVATCRDEHVNGVMNGEEIKQALLWDSLKQRDRDIKVK